MKTQELLVLSISMLLIFFACDNPSERLKKDHEISQDGAFSREYAKGEDLLSSKQYFEAEILFRDLLSVTSSLKERKSVAKSLYWALINQGKIIGERQLLEIMFHPSVTDSSEYPLRTKMLFEFYLFEGDLKNATKCLDSLNSIYKSYPRLGLDSIWFIQSYELVKS